MPDVEDGQAPGARKLTQKLQKAGVTDSRPNAALWYDLDWGAYGYGAGLILGLLVGFLFFMLLDNTVLPSLGPSGQLSGLGTFLMFALAISLCWIGRIWGYRYACRLQLRRLDPDGHFALPSQGWFAVANSEIVVWVGRTWWPLRLRAEPACRIPALGWSATLPEEISEGRTNTVMMSDPHGVSIPFVCSSGSDIERVAQLLSEQNESPPSSIG